MAPEGLEEEEFKGEEKEHGDGARRVWKSSLNGKERNTETQREGSGK